MLNSSNNEMQHELKFSQKLIQYKVKLKNNNYVRIINKLHPPRPQTIHTRVST